MIVPLVPAVMSFGDLWGRGEPTVIHTIAKPHFVLPLSEPYNELPSLEGRTILNSTVFGYKQM